MSSAENQRVSTLCKASFSFSIDDIDKKLIDININAKTWKVQTEEQVVNIYEESEKGIP